MATYWLIESADIPPQFLTMRHGHFWWTTDKEEALHLSRREDAERVAAENEDAWHVREYEQ
jgi:hypothetical protein